MKALTLFILVILVLPLSIQAQNVGINTNNPQTDLDVNGITTTDTLFIGNAYSALGKFVGNYLELRNSTNIFLNAGYGGNVINDIHFRINNNPAMIIDGATMRMGMGTYSPKERIDINGALKIGGASNTNAGTIQWDGSDFMGHNGTMWQSLTGGGGVFENNSGTVRNTGNHASDDLVFGSTNLPDNMITNDTLMFFDKSKGAFRSGLMINSRDWSPDSIGLASTAFGRNTRALGNYSTALGNYSKAKGSYSVSMGNQSSAIGNTSLATGNFTRSLGDLSAAMGNGTIAPSFSSMAIGQYNDTLATSNKDVWTPTDPLLMVGMGTDDVNRANALTILKNGEVSLKNYTFPMADGTADQVMKTDGNGNITWTDMNSGGGSGVFENNAGLVRNTGNHASDDFVFGSDALPSQGIALDLTLFDKSKGAFRTGRHALNAWLEDSLGVNSFATGYATRATGPQSTALGNETLASGSGATAMGIMSEAIGDVSIAGGWRNESRGIGSIALGYQNHALGDNGSAAIGRDNLLYGLSSTAIGVSNQSYEDFTAAIGVANLNYYSHSVNVGNNNRNYGSYSFTLGRQLLTNSYGLIALGNYNDTMALSNRLAWDPSDPLLMVGMGQNEATRENALTILKNGTVSFKEYKFPNYDGSANQMLKTDGNGNLSWSSSSGIWSTYGASNIRPNNNEKLVLGYTGNQSSYSTLSVGNISDANNEVYFESSKPHVLKVKSNATGNTSAVRVESSGTNTQAMHLTSTGSSSSTLLVQNWYSGSENNNHAVLVTQNSKGSAVSISNTGSNNATGMAVSATLGSSSVAIRANASHTGIRSNGTVNDYYAWGPGVDYASQSSRRWKNNIVNISNPIEKIKKLRGVYYDWDEEHGGGSDVGFIAEEVAEVLPEIVVFNEDGINVDGLDYSKTTPLIVEAVNTIIDDYKQKFDQQQAIITQQSEQIQAMEKSLQDLRDVTTKLTAAMNAQAGAGKE